MIDIPQEQLVELVNLRMDTVCLKPLYHRGKESIAIHFANDASLNLIVRKLPQVEWSQTNRCWYLSLNAVSYKQICKALEGKSALDNTALKKYLEKRKQVTSTLSFMPGKKNSKHFLIKKKNKNNEF